MFPPGYQPQPQMPVIVQGQPVIFPQGGLPGYSQLPEPDILPENNALMVKQVEFNQLDPRLDTEFSCYKCVLITSVVFDIVGIIVTLASKSGNGNIVGLILSAVRLFVYYNAYNALKEKDLIQQRKVVKWLKIMLMIACGCLSCFMLIFIAGSIILRESQMENTSDKQGYHDEQFAGAMFAILFAVTMFYIVFGVGIPLYLYNQARKILIMMERKRELAYQLGIQLPIGAAGNNL